MKYNLFLLFLVGTLMSCKQNNGSEMEAKVSAVTSAPEYAIVIHGGAGNITSTYLTNDSQSNYEEALNKALTIGEEILKNGGTSLEAVEETINFMEDSPLFNAGKGAVYTNAGTNSLDASIMQGNDRDAGAVGGVSNVKNPIDAAIAVMQKSKHVMLSGKGADQFSKEQGLEIVDPSYFKTEKAWNRLQKALAKEKVIDEKHGTVGCVALDKFGNIVAGTSTGGMSNKKYDRIGDSPIIGAGTYADNKTCGVSCTGHGEFFIRNTVARDIAAMMEYKGASLDESAKYIVQDVLVKAGGDGGIIALDKNGNISMEFNTPGMFRGYAKPGERAVAMFKD